MAKDYKVVWLLETELLIASIDFFGIYIECDRSNGYVYYIGNAKVLDDDTIQTWMLSTLSISNKILTPAQYLNMVCQSR